MTWIRPSQRLKRPPKEPVPETPKDFWAWLNKAIVRRFGWYGLAILVLLTTAFGVWSQWSSIRTWPGMATVETWLTRAPIPSPDPGKFTIAVFRLVNDPDNQERRHLEVAIGKSKPDYVSLKAIDRAIPVRPTELTEGNREGHEAVRRILKDHGYQGALWGELTTIDGKRVPLLHWTTLAENVRVQDNQNYPIQRDLQLPALFWEHLATVLAVVVQEQAALAAPDGQFPDWKQYETLLGRLRQLLRSEGPSWAPEDRARTVNVLSNSLRVAGERRGRSEEIEEAIGLLRDLLTSLDRERTPRVWAMTQNNLGIALRRLGERTGNLERLEDAITAFRSALQERTRERAPMDWAMTQNNLGNALQDLGKHTGNLERLEDAITAFRSALQERTRERAPMDWAATQNNLGNALRRLGERTGNAERLEDAIAAFRSALQAYTRERAPMNWATTQNNLGDALQALGERTDNAERLEDAITAFRSALQELTPDRALAWNEIARKNLALAEQALADLQGRAN